MKLTPWFPGDINPVRVGPYERDYDDGNGSAYCYWNGRYFGWSAETPAAATTKAGQRSAKQDLPWRGLAEGPKS